jgi:hypothetical protein
VFLQFPPGPLAVFSQVPSEQQHWLLLVQHVVPQANFPSAQPQVRVAAVTVHGLEEHTQSSLPSPPVQVSVPQVFVEQAVGHV